MISTLTALTSASGRADQPPNASQSAKVASASASTTGTKRAVTRSARSWIGRRAPCAVSTMRMTSARNVSAPTRVARRTKAPARLTLPPIAESPGFFATGTDSPEMKLSSTWLAPSVTSPSTGTDSPGRTSTTSPASTSATGRSRVTPSRRTWAILGWSRASLPMESAARPRERASSQRPSRMKATMIAADSK